MVSTSLPGGAVERNMKPIESAGAGGEDGVLAAAAGSSSASARSAEIRLTLALSAVDVSLASSELIFLAMLAKETAEVPGQWIEPPLPAPRRSTSL